MMSQTMPGGDARREDRWLRASERWTRVLLRLFPADFRDEVGEAFVGTYRDRSRAALRRGGLVALAGIWLTALADSVKNGVGERVNPGITWRRGGNWGRDTERVVRRLTRAPVFVLTMVGTLTIGLGAFAVVYTVVDKVLLAPLPYERPNDLYLGWRNYTWVPFEHGWLGGPDVAALQKAGGAIDGVAGLRRTDGTLSGGTGEPEEVSTIVATPNLFRVLGVRARLGRTFAPNEGGPGRPPVIVLSHHVWQRRFGGDPALVGRDVRLNDVPYTVIGIMAPDFHFARPASLGTPESGDVFTTVSSDLAALPPNNGSWAGIIRARPGATREQVESAVASVARMLDERDFSKKGLEIELTAMKEEIVAGVRPALIVLGSAGVFLLLVLGVNLATLLLVRASQREREVAITRALGANRVALVRATLLEGALLGAMGGAGGALVATWGARALVTIAPLDLPRRESIGVDWRIALTVVAVGTLLGLVAAILPSVWSTRASLSSLLSNAAVRGGGGGHGRMRRGLVVVQVAMSLVLLSAGGLVVRSFERLLRAQPGFDESGVLTMRVPVSRQRYADSTAINGLHARIEQALAALPGVTAVGAGSAIPLTASADQAGATFPGAPGNTGVEEHDSQLVDYISTRGRYFESLGIKVLAGRVFAEGRTPGVREVILDRSLAEWFYPRGNAIGGRMTLNGDTLTIVGVVEHARQYDVHKDGRMQAYIRNENEPYASLFFTVRTTRDPARLAAEAEAAVHGVDAQLAVAGLRPMEQVVNESMRQQRLSAVLISGFSIGALLLASMGLFGIVSGAVNRRQHELAVRLALGADHARVMRLVLGEGVMLVALGLLVGIPGVYYAGRLVSGILVGVSPYDLVTLGTMAAGLAAVALLACWVPARRVAGIQPASSLREG